MSEVSVLDAAWSTFLLFLLTHALTYVSSQARRYLEVGECGDHLLVEGFGGLLLGHGNVVEVDGELLPLHLEELA